LWQAFDLAREYFKNPHKAEGRAEIGSFREVADTWIKRHVEANKLITGYELKRHLTKYVYPYGGIASCSTFVAAT